MPDSRISAPFFLCDRFKENPPFGVIEPAGAPVHASAAATNGSRHLMKRRPKPPKHPTHIRYGMPY